MKEAQKHRVELIKGLKDRDIELRLQSAGLPVESESELCDFRSVASTTESLCKT